MLNNSIIKSRLDSINRRLRFIKKAGPQSIKYLFNNTNLFSGKRIRGLLVLLTAETNIGKSSNGIVNTAVAMELLHHATLIHDDIIDNSEKRRGEPTLNRRVGYELSVLTGDYLFSYATNVILQEKNIRILKIYSNAVKDVCEGEIEEVYNKNNTALNETQYLKIIEKKTASLIKASVEAGAHAGGINSRTLKYLKEFGKNTGMAFQIKDDILDMNGRAKKLGKPVGNDIKEGKVTLPLIHALKKAKKKERQKIINIFKRKANGGNVKVIIEFIRRHRGIEEAEAVAKRYIGKAKKNLGKVTVKYKKKKELLDELADYIVERNY